jgi:hypothetical protein
MEIMSSSTRFVLNMIYAGIHGIYKIKIVHRSSMEISHLVHMIYFNAQSLSNQAHMPF